MDSSSSTSSMDATGRRGISAAAFVEDVQTYITQLGLDVNSALNFLQERLQQYKMVEMKLLAQQRELQAKIPDIGKCLAVVGTLQEKKGSDESILANFEVSEGIYPRARIEETDSVCLWLGVNVMLEYSCEEAVTLLKNNLENAKGSLEVLIADLQFLRDQVTITQVTIARVYNWDVHQRRLRQASGSKEYRVKGVVDQAWKTDREVGGIFPKAVTHSSEVPSLETFNRPYSLYGIFASQLA